ncbi:MAG TPA: bifunctional methylenetetrahydrofolate dehydrogenase/methenyltetrahydrofolate cyclohydrolase FolD [Ignavibacteriaceae bacterium]|jgi:methylenetetrahydrofolate dehydrogenase (NADP+)/methenyltetrahydrofolate cyclohydrolase|nr:MAG: Bifunctional protein FolD protein [Ignavibacteria bacterium ADurb.Bin266]OQY72689.1 MAG: bifunctional 5,10-methylene-tetrahydrofolate dehydrogenase/5,10-methylene-tetrahydrofolate cyclohydrolase [Ignavibacteriales bacterium UTCHB2]HQF43260.1 bifunctional methylenetetrahydrofolate dehydrogenase/methenyltetrahydrofolate cyclohydrolase FolD [Ignavibacteriaceae bacterium]HQI41827.1 bifunctional methylenetetrahydrofolate dehydrogenase/methenyltetrahydrofolate cyclohydrolase FolD [Ignavibacter
MNLIDGKKVAADIRNELKEKISKLKAEEKNVPGLVAIIVGDDPASHIYVSSKGKACEEIGMRTKTEKLPADITEDKLLELIKSYNENKDFHGILVQLPLPKHINEDKVIETISSKKDVDGFHPISVGNLVIGKDTFASCTPAGIQELLIRYKIETKGKHVVVVGRSNIVGKPITNIMLQKAEGANSIVTIVHSAAKDISYYTKQADILIAAIGKPEMIKADMVKDGVVVVDVGINRIDDPSKPKGYRIVGDVDFENVSKKASYITPVPGGVGPMTIAMLLSNTFKAYNLYGEK